MFRLLFGRLLILGALWGACGCGDKPGPPRIATFPVMGSVLVDGQPVGNVAVYCVRQSAPDKEHPTKSQCFTNEDGSFKIGTYEAKDGVPEGDYVLTFQWGELNLFSRAYEGDKLNGRYSDPAASTIKFTVANGKPVDLGKIELTTK